jgi:hypothetical protein
MFVTGLRVRELKMFETRVSRMTIEATRFTADGIVV